MKLCSKCGGEGLITVPTFTFTGKPAGSYQTFCPDCNGRGRVPDENEPTAGSAQDGDIVDVREGKNENGSSRR